MACITCLQHVGEWILIWGSWKGLQQRDINWVRRKCDLNWWEWWRSNMWGYADDWSFSTLVVTICCDDNENESPASNDICTILAENLWFPAGFVVHKLYVILKLLVSKIDVNEEPIFSSRFKGKQALFKI